MAIKSTVIRISPGTKGANLNALADRMVREGTPIIEQFTEFELIEGRSSLFGSGETPILTIVIKYDQLTTEQLEAMQQMLAWARESGATIDIQPPTDEQ